MEEQSGGSWWEGISERRAHEFMLKEDHELRRWARRFVEAHPEWGFLVSQPRENGTVPCILYLDFWVKPEAASPTSSVSKDLPPRLLRLTREKRRTLVSFIARALKDRGLRARHETRLGFVHYTIQPENLKQFRTLPPTTSRTVEMAVATH